jgi:hypothetical protein
MLIVSCCEGVGPRPTRHEFDTREGHDSKRGLAARPLTRSGRITMNSLLDTLGPQGMTVKTAGSEYFSTAP